MHRQTISIIPIILICSYGLVGCSIPLTVRTVQTELREGIGQRPLSLRELLFRPFNQEDKYILLAFEKNNADLFTTAVYLKDYRKKNPDGTLEDFFNYLLEINEVGISEWRLKQLFDGVRRVYFFLKETKFLEDIPVERIPESPEKDLYIIKKVNRVKSDEK